MKKISYDRKSLLIDGKRVFIISGEVHYFRIPRALWRDRLIKSKEAGLNTIGSLPVEEALQLIEDKSNNLLNQTN